MNKFKEYLLLLIVFLIPWQARWLPSNYVFTDIYNEYTLPSLFVIDVLLVLAVLLFFPWNNLKKPDYKILLLVLGWLTVNAAFAIQPFFVIWRALFLLVLVAFIYLVGNNVDASKIKAVLIATAVLQAVIGLAQFFIQYIPASTWLGIAEQTASTLGSSVIETANGRWLRAYGTFPHPNILGGFLTLSLLLVVDWYQNTYQEFKTWLKNKKDTYSNEDKQYLKRTGLKISVLLISFSIIFSGLLVSFSRSAWLAFAGGLVIYTVLQLSKKQNVLPSVKLSLTGLLIASTFFLFYSELFTTRISNETRLENTSVEERVEGYKVYSGILRNNWLTGSGMGNYVFEMSHQSPGQPAYIYQPIHNTWLLLFAEIGILGLVLLIYLFRSRKNFWTDLSVSVLVAVVIIGLFDHYLWSIHAGVVLLYLFWVYSLTLQKR